MGLEDALEEPGFYILGAFTTVAMVIGFIASKRMTEYTFPIWQFIIMLIGGWVASAYFATKE